MSIPASKKEGCLEYVKGCVEEALATSHVTDDLYINYLAGQMSVYPERVGPKVNAEIYRVNVSLFLGHLKRL